MVSLSENGLQETTTESNNPEESNNTLIETVDPVIKESINRRGDRIYGFVDLGVSESDCSTNDTISTKANHTLVFLLVALNYSWKVPLAYLLVHGIGGLQRSKLLKLTLHLLHEHDIKLHSIAYDGDRVNYTMVEALGADMNVTSPYFKPYFLHPKSKEKIFVFPDPSHMTKNTRGAFSTTNQKGIEKPFVDANGDVISWRHIVDLNTYQEREGLNAANKVTIRHINFHENPMNVRLAAQVLSNSTADALVLLKTINVSGFENVNGTMTFCFTVSLINLFDLFDLLNEKYGLEYILTYKLLQDSIENLFSAVRTMGGFCNNPTPYKFECAMRRIIIHEMMYSAEANCLADNLQILNVDSSFQPEEDDNFEMDFPDYDAGLFNFQNVYIPSAFVTHVSRYICGFIVHKLKLSRSKISCPVCFDFVSGEVGSSLLTDIKNHGNLCYASEAVVNFGIKLEGILRDSEETLMHPKFMKECLLHIKENIKLFDHDHGRESGHGDVLTHYLAKSYLTIRLHHEISIAEDPPSPPALKNEDHTNTSSIPPNMLRVAIDNMLYYGITFANYVKSYIVGDEGSLKYVINKLLEGAELSANYLRNSSLIAINSQPSNTSSNNKEETKKPETETKNTEAETKPAK
ncbi:hypothetical protein V9T40_014083 [Parthenolecanium corni]|uniref:DNA transposase THAP9 n=1 Tax=Parthenolecanium corni TaxID=536013 RepID=A0AAN9Y338_9HEMI